MTGLWCFDEIEITLSGIPNPATGYLVDIKEIDAMVRSEFAPTFWAARENRPHAEPAEVLGGIFSNQSSFKEAFGPTCHLCSIKWYLTPYYSVEMRADRQTTVLIRQSFDFAAAHRLHTPSLSEETNRQLFGKCNNPSGHGHNYRVEPCVEVSLDRDGNQPFTLRQLEFVTGTTIIDRFDHTHLNLDTSEFGPSGVNPTVENIARVFFELLAPEIQRSCGAAALRSLTVWETDRTCCTYSP